MTASVWCVWAEKKPYFSTAEMPNAVKYMPGPPERGTARFAYDSAQYVWGKSMRATARGEKARLDAEFSIERMAAIFSPVMGIEISEKNTPALWKLLEDATATTGKACHIAKETYMRPRPYMVYNEPTLVPEDEEDLSHNGSYPSGHTTLGWSTATGNAGAGWATCSPARATGTSRAASQLTSSSATGASSIRRTAEIATKAASTTMYSTRRMPKDASRVT